MSVRYTRRPLIGVVGEIACRLTPSMNDDVIRSIEERGGECTLAHIVEWVFYTNTEHQRRLRQQGRRFSKAMLAAKISDHIQHRDEHRLSRSSPVTSAATKSLRSSGCSATRSRTCPPPGRSAR